VTLSELIKLCESYNPEHVELHLYQDGRCYHLVNILVEPLGFGQKIICDLKKSDEASI